MRDRQTSGWWELGRGTCTPSPAWTLLLPPAVYIGQPSGHAPPAQRVCWKVLPPGHPEMLGHQCGARRYQERTEEQAVAPGVARGDPPTPGSNSAGEARMGEARHRSPPRQQARVSLGESRHPPTPSDKDSLLGKAARRGGGQGVQPLHKFELWVTTRERWGGELHEWWSSAVLSVSLSLTIHVRKKGKKKKKKQLEVEEPLKTLSPRALGGST